MDALADEHGLSLVIVGSIDPEAPEAAMLADLDDQARSARFRGVRVFPGIALDHAAVPALLGWLERRGHVFDLVTGPSRMAEWAAVLERFPGLTVALEHTGSPESTGTEGFTAWRGALTAFAARTGAVCKVSGLGMATLDLSEKTLRPWVETAVDAFGWDRVLFGSNMPIETMAGPFSQWISTVDAVIGAAAADEQKRFYAVNAARTYRI